MRSFSQASVRLGTALLSVSTIPILFLPGCASRQVVATGCPEGAHTVGAPPPGGSQEGCIRIKRNGTAEKHGLWKFWDGSGTLRETGEFRWGKKCGKWKIWTGSGSTPTIKDFGPCPTRQPCKHDLDCEPPFTRCDEARGICVDGCYQIPCDKGFVCSSETGECIRNAGEIRIQPPSGD